MQARNVRSAVGDLMPSRAHNCTAHARQDEHEFLAAVLEARLVTWVEPVLSAARFDGDCAAPLFSALDKCVAHMADHQSTWEDEDVFRGGTVLQNLIIECYDAVHRSRFPTRGRERLCGLLDFMRLHTVEGWSLCPPPQVLLPRINCTALEIQLKLLVELHKDEEACALVYTAALSYPALGAIRKRVCDYADAYNAAERVAQVFAERIR